MTHPFDDAALDDLESYMSLSGTTNAFNREAAQALHQLRAERDEVRKECDQAQTRIMEMSVELEGAYTELVQTQALPQSVETQAALDGMEKAKKDRVLEAEDKAHILTVAARKSREAFTLSERVAVLESDLAARTRERDEARKMFENGQWNWIREKIS